MTTVGRTTIEQAKQIELAYNNPWIQKLARSYLEVCAERDALQARVKELEADRERLDWLTLKMHDDDGTAYRFHTSLHEGIVLIAKDPDEFMRKLSSGDSFREAIDAAREGSKGE
jgi:hypothetical protein